MFLIASESLTPCTVISTYFSKDTVMDDSSSEFHAKKIYTTGPRKVQKPKVSRAKKPLKKIKNQKDIRTLIKNQNSELVSYSKAFDQVCKKSGLDIDPEQLQLAIALSKSLQETETKVDENLQESKPLSSQEKTARIRITLQEYGFRVPNTKVSKDSNKRKKIKKQYKLLLVSDEEKERIISERYAEVLVKNICKSPLKNKISSNNYYDLEVFYKGTNIPYECMKIDDVFYVKDLFEKTKDKYCMLRDWSNIPGRPASPKREEKYINFENIDCTQDELDVILSGSIYAAQNIIEKKSIVNNCNMFKSSGNNSQDMVIDVDVDNDIKVSTNNEMNNSSSHSKNNSKFDAMLSVSQKNNNGTIASTNKEISDLCTNSKNCLKLNTMLTITQNVRSASPDLFDDDMSLTSDNTQNTIQTVEDNVTQSKNNVTDCMDLTECVSSAPERDKTFKNKLSLQKVNITNRKSNVMEITECVSTNIKQNCVDIDLTQDFIPQNEKNENNIETENFETDLTQSKFPVNVFDANIAAIERKDLLDKTIINSDCAEIVSDKVSNKEILTSRINPEIKNDDNAKVEKTECLPSSSKQNVVENIDLTQITYSNINLSNNLLPENLHIDLTQTNSYIFSLTERASSNTDNLVGDVIIVGDSELLSDPISKENTSIHRKDLIIANSSKNTEDNTLKPKDIDNSCNIDEYNLSKENNANLEIDITQSSNSDNGSEIGLTKKDDFSDKTSPVINKELPNTPKDSSIVYNDCNKSEENNEIDDFDYNHEFYSYNEHLYNDSYYCHNNDLPYNNSQDKVEMENTDCDDKSTFYAKSPNNNSFILMNDNVCNPFKQLEKNNDAKSDVAEADGIDLTQSSDSSNEAIEKCILKDPDINNLGKVDNMSVDYDEMFDNVVSVGSKCTSQTSLKSNNNTFKSRSQAGTSNNEDSSPSKESECFEISDKEFNYSMHQSRHNFEIGGVSILDNVSDFEMHSFKENKCSRISLNRSFSHGDIPTSVNKICTPKAVLNSQKVISDTSTPIITKCVIKEVQNTPRNSNYIIKTENVTPMMDYEAMTSPERNRELEKYGLKPFKRKRGNVPYIYYL